HRTPRPSVLHFTPVPHSRPLPRTRRRARPRVRDQPHAASAATEPRTARVTFGPGLVPTLTAGGGFTVCAPRRPTGACATPGGPARRRVRRPDEPNVTCPGAATALEAFKDRATAPTRFDGEPRRRPRPNTPACASDPRTPTPGLRPATPRPRTQAVAPSPRSYHPNRISSSRCCARSARTPRLARFSSSTFPYASAASSKRPSA